MIAQMFYRLNVLKHSPQLPVIVVNDIYYQVAWKGYMYSYSPCKIADKCDDITLGMYEIADIFNATSTGDIIENKRIFKVCEDYFFKLEDVLYKIE